MKLGTFVFLGATGLVSVCFAGAGMEGCGGGSTGNSSSSGGGSGSGSGSGPNVSCDDGGACVKQPPVPADAGVTTLTTPQNFALHHLHLGEELDSTGQPTWANYGYNIDGKNTTAMSTDVCTLAPDANKKNQIDGEPGGIDNSFGENIILGLLYAVISDPSTTIDTSLAEGHFTVFMDVTGLSPNPGQTATGLSGFILGGVPFAQGANGDAGPTFTLADNWPVDPGSLMNPPVPPSITIPTPISSKVTFSDSYVTNGVFVSGTPTNVTLTLTIDGVPLVIPIQNAIITFNHPGADGGTHNISGGIIAGVIDAEQLVTNLQGVAGNIESSLCEGSTFDQLKQQILGTADIMDNGTNAAGEQCNGISIGVGFDADEIAQPTVTGVPSTGTNPCEDAGTGEDAGEDSGGGGADSGPADAGPG